MAPEQVRGEPVAPQTDLFALGAVMYECLSGTAPFRRDTAVATLAAVLEDPPPPLPGVGEDFVRLVERCLAKRIVDRPASATEIADALVRIQREPETTTAAPPLGPVTIAVLPFTDLSAAKDQQYLCDGLADEILHSLSRLGGVRVAPRASSFHFRGDHDLRAVAQRLEVEHILEGTVRRSGDRIRITVQLVDVGAGRTLWAQRYDRDARDVLEIQDEIAASTAAQLSIVVTDEARRAWRQRGARDLAAYEAYLEGTQNNTRCATRRAAIAAFERAVAIDPSFAAAWAALADAYACAFRWLGRLPEDASRAEAASERAFALAPDSAETHAGRAQALTITGRNNEAIAEFERALAASPGLYDALYPYAKFRVLRGDYAAAVDLFEQAARVRPDDFQALCLALGPYRKLGDDDREVDCALRAVARVERRLALVPGDVRALYLGANAYVALGERDRALAMATRALELEPDESGTLYDVACVLSRLGRLDDAVRALERAGDKGLGERAWVERDPDLEALHPEPRFQALLDRLPG